jgi:xanthine dehydrogenase molybdenum-binding subunit
LNLTVSHVAAELGIDPTIVALKNDGAVGEGMDFLKELKKEQGFPDRDSLQECIDAAKEAIDFDNVWHKAGTKKLADGRMHGIGFAWDHEWTDMTFWGQVQILMSGGKVEIIGNQVDVGVNSASAYCQVVAEEVGLKYEDVYYKPNCEGHGINLAFPASASNMATNGWALKKASQQLKAQILHMAINGPEQDLYPTYETPNVPDIKPLFPGKTADELDVKGGYVFEKANPDNKQTIAAVTSASGGFSPYQAPLTAWGWYSAGNWGCDTPYRERMTRQAHFTEVAVDTETGEIEVLRVINVNDVGQAVSPESVMGQMYGGTIMGISRGKYEESIYDPSTGVKLNANLLDYKTSTIEDCGPITPIIVETHLGYGPYGCVGVGEGCADLLPSTIGPAVQNAIGVWIDDYPITPEKVLKALGKA